MPIINYALPPTPYPIKTHLDVPRIAAQLTRWRLIMHPLTSQLHTGTHRVNIDMMLHHQHYYFSYFCDLPVYLRAENESTCTLYSTVREEALLSRFALGLILESSRGGIRRSVRQSSRVESD